LGQRKRVQLFGQGLEQQLRRLDNLFVALALFEYAVAADHVPRRAQPSCGV